MKHIYVVEDHPKNMNLFKMILSVITKDKKKVKFYDSFLSKDGIRLTTKNNIREPEIIVFTSMNGGEGFKLITSNKLFIENESITEIKIETPDLIILDIQLPELSGVDICYRLRKIKRFRDVPIYAVTAHARPGDKEAIIAAGFTQYIEKPIETISFLSLIREELNIKF